MKAVKIADLKDRLSEHLRAVERGGEVLVTDRDRPIARIVPLAAAVPAATIDPPAMAFAAVRTRRPPPSARWKLSSRALLSAERGDR